MLARLIRRVLTWKSLALPLRALLLTAVFLGSAPLILHAQGGAITFQVVQPPPPVGTGGPAVNPLVYVCPFGASGNPCATSGVLLYSNPTLTAAVSNPYTGDQWGNVSVFAATGAYLVNIVPVPGVTYQYAVFAVGGTVTSITIVPSATLFTSSGCFNITTTGTCTFNLASQAANEVFASPNGGSGIPFWRNIVGPDFGPLITSNTVLGNCASFTTSPSFCALTANMIPSTLNSTTFAGSINATTGYQFNGIALLNHVLLGNGTYYVDAALTISDVANLSNLLGQSTISGTSTGTGAGTSPTLTCLSCQDNGGDIDLITGSGPTGVIVLSVDFGGTHAGAYCALSPSNGPENFLLISTGAAGFTLENTGSALDAATAYGWTYTCTFR